MSIYTTFDQAITYNESEIKTLFANAKGWEGKYRQIMLLGKQLPALADEYKQDTHLVKGCESQVWLHFQIQDEKNRGYQFAADSDARIVKGLVIVILAAFNHKTAQQISDFDIEGYFAELDLLKHLSPSRSNGIHAIVQAIREI
ncbi:MAG: SufE family protein [Algicola sp.]|nr:SufE family protein [Algicola sp.]